MNNTEHTYPYSKYIKAPEKLGSSSKANALGKNVGALRDYVQVLVTGQTKAQDVSPLGNKYFMDTKGTCKDSNGTTQSRFVFINNIPDGTIPFISSGMGVQLTSFEGLVPGVLGDLTYLNPFKIFSAFDTETTCQKIKMPVRDINNATGEEEQYVCDSDIAEYNPCWFSSNTNPVTKEKCPSTSNKKKKKKNGMTLQYSPLPNDVIFKTYEYGIYLLGVYILYRIAVKR
jgi:hypothetical protein